MIFQYKEILNKFKQKSDVKEFFKKMLTFSKKSGIIFLNFLINRRKFLEGRDIFGTLLEKEAESNGGQGGYTASTPSWRGAEQGCASCIPSLFDGRSVLLKDIA